MPVEQSIRLIEKRLPHGTYNAKSECGAVGLRVKAFIAALLLYKS